MRAILTRQSGPEMGVSIIEARPGPSVTASFARQDEAVWATTRVSYDNWVGDRPA